MASVYSNDSNSNAVLEPDHLEFRNNGSDLRSPVALAIAALLAVVCVTDHLVTLGVTVWVFYLIPVILTFRLWDPRSPLYVTCIILFLLFLGFTFSKPGIDPSVAAWNRAFGGMTVALTGLVGYWFVRNRLAIQHHQWMQAGRFGLNQAVAGNQVCIQLGENILKFLAKFLNARSGVIYLSGEGRFVQTATYGVPVPNSLPESFFRGEGLAGQAVRDQEYFLLENLDQHELTVGSATGQWKPKTLLVAPVSIDDMVIAVIELGFLESPPDATIELMKDISESVGVAIQTAQYRQDLQRLLEETQRQAEELQVQGEELRVSNEELEEQSRALLESQSRLEQQQVELEQTNTQLEEQTQLLEAQKDDLAKARLSIEEKVKDLERASRYKSDFLANMSHELRTPLNSSLILAKLLAENPDGNLTEEQVTSAETILSAGNDLLNLINDILDLSKIEAGRLEIHPEQVLLEELTSNVENTIRPLVSDRNLEFQIQIASDVPASIHTDTQRLEQILKNLLSNAVKFTDQGMITLQIRSTDRNHVCFDVIDPGIGIEENQQAAIFEAFRQVDSAANRRYSGTGLGLSITRQLVLLLGGEIQLASTPGQGSTFTVILPVNYTGPRPSIASAVKVISTVGGTDDKFSLGLLSQSSDRGPIDAPQVPAPVSHQVTTRVRRPSRIKDDREKLTGDRPVILVVEDDEPFARILYKLSHELEFQCLLAQTAEDAVAVATQYLPSAVVLDLGLPDHSGLAVLDQLKHDSRTRHIPVHVVSASDHAQAAFALGAVGYIRKPVTKDKLTETLKGLETRLTQRMRRVLLVDDDKVQLESLGKLLGSHDVETVGVRSVADCLDKLKTATFDCMVLDLSLPDESGFSLLEKLSREDAYSFPPVIVYTGADLSPQEEHKLRRYSKSIIIKGAKSPERLLDEVTLFLHQVVAELPPEQQKMIKRARSREAALEDRRILVVEDDVRNVFALTSILEPRGAIVQIARNGIEAIKALEEAGDDPEKRIDLILMDVMMPEMDGLTATREIRKRPEWQKMPIVILTAKAMKEDQQNCMEAGANDYMAKPLDVEKLLSLVRVWIRR
ncbi:MAG TPA: response regulator [Planctomicrobium sp.]|nr:response regulator [Planctomicrobium sp.]